MFLQQEKICEQEKIIRHLRGKIGGKKVSVEDVEIMALGRLPKLEEHDDDKDTSAKDDGRAVENEKSDGDSAIHLDRSNDSLHLTDRTEGQTVSRHLQRSVSDVVQTHLRHVKMSDSEKELSPFCNKLYRGFLLRHRKRHKHSVDKQ